MKCPNEIDVTTYGDLGRGVFVYVCGCPVGHSVREELIMYGSDPRADRAAARDRGPDYYKWGANSLQPWDVIDAFELDFYLGNVIKYVCRAGLKGPALDDLRKAQHYIEKAIEKEMGQ
ncbi:DUF3310 domain-containing protein [Streptomyces sp. NPDC048611]|uniref:DUF3310 domain-containing protein n=1 Tax=Streptomyces sp. NPDC048611 TaxID=3155635 RepID=UPI0034151D59